MSRRRFLPAALAAAAALSGSPAHAQFTVFDPSNYAENLLQSARALEQIQNQLAALQNQAQLLAGQARNLTPLGFKAAGALNADLARVNGLLNQAGRIAQDAQALRQQFASQYPADATGASGKALADAAETRWRNSLEALQRALLVQAEVVQSLSATDGEAEALASQSEGAAGALQAAQAGNQLLAVQSKQLSDLTALIAAQGQAQALEAARAAAATAEGRARLARFLGTAP